MNKLLLESLQIVSGFVPIDMKTGANTGDIVSMKGYRRLAVVFFKAAGTGGDDPTLTIEQMTDVSNSQSDNKALNFTTIYSKEGTQTSIGQWTKTTQAAANTYTNATLAEKQAIIVVEFKAEDLDIDNNFDCVRASVADVGTNAQLGCLLYLLGDPIESQAPENMLSAIAD